MKNYLLLLFLIGSISAFGQCLSGSLTVTGAGCGCLSECDLSAYGGPDCDAGLTGNCASGQVNMSLTLALPGDCQVTAEARMSSRPGCSASGADSGDKLRVNGTSPHAWQTGAGNATLFDSNTQQGGSLIIEGTANRADEIITYEVFFVSGTCPFCILLPVELTTFDAQLDLNTLSLFWETASELNNSGFAVQVSRDQQEWESKAFVPGQGTTSTNTSYAYSVDLTSGLWYVRLAQLDYNGQTTFSPVLAATILEQEWIELTPATDGVLVRNASSESQQLLFTNYASTGQILDQVQLDLGPGASVPRPLFKGMNLIQVQSTSSQVVQRIFH